MLAWLASCVQVKAEADDRTAAATAAAVAAATDAFPDGLLTLESLSIPRLLSGGALLLGSSGAEYAGGGGDVATQRARLQEHLGLDGRLGGASEVLDIKDEDLAARRGAGGGAAAVAAASTGSAESVGDMVAEMGGGEAGLSARERNRLKREAKKRTKLGHAPAGRPPKRPRPGGSGGAGGGDGGDGGGDDSGGNGGSGGNSGDSGDSGSCG